MSTDEGKNPECVMIEKLKAIRNAPAQSLYQERRAKALAAMEADYERGF